MKKFIFFKSKSFILIELFPSSKLSLFILILSLFFSKSKDKLAMEFFVFHNL